MAEKQQKKEEKQNPQHQAEQKKEKNKSDSIWNSREKYKNVGNAVIPERQVMCEILWGGNFDV